MSLSTRLMAEESVNADDAHSVGEKILTSMVSHYVSEYKFSQNNQVKTLASAVHGEHIKMDHQRLCMSRMYASTMAMHWLCLIGIMAPALCPTTMAFILSVWAMIACGAILLHQ